METFEKITNNREVEPVGQRQATLIEHQVYDGEVKLLLLELSDQVLVQDGLAVLGQQDLVPPDHLSHCPEYVGTKAPD